MSKIIAKAVALLLCLTLVAPPCFAKPKTSCDVLISDSYKDEEERQKPFNLIKFRQFRQTKKGEEGHGVRSNRYLKEGNLAIAFSRDGALKLFYGDREILFDKNGDLTFNVTPVEHQMDMLDFDLIIVYKNIRGDLRRRIEKVFNPEPQQIVETPGYNCVDAICRIIKLDDGYEVDTRVFKPDDLIVGLIRNGRGNIYFDMEVLVAENYKTPGKFYSKMQFDKYRDPFTPLDFIGEITVAGVVLGTGAMGFVFILVKLLDFLIYGF